MSIISTCIGMITMTGGDFVFCKGIVLPVLVLCCL